MRRLKEENYFEWEVGGEIIRVGHRNEARKGENKI